MKIKKEVLKKILDELENSFEILEADGYKDEEQPMKQLIGIYKMLYNYELEQNNKEAKKRLEMFEKQVLKAQENLALEVDNELKYFQEVWSETKKDPSYVLTNNIDVGGEGLRELIGKFKENERVLRRIRRIKKGAEE